MTVSEKVAYLKGLAEGLAVDTETKEGKLLNAIIDTLEVIAEEIEEIEENALDIAEEIDAISDDLAEVEDVVFEDDDDDEDYDDDEDCDCEYMYSVTCPACGDEIEVDEDILEAGVLDCPNCGEKLELDFDGDEENEDED